MKTLFTLLFSLSVVQSFAHTDPKPVAVTGDTLQVIPASAAYSVTAANGISESIVPYRKNTVKVNLSSLAFNNYSLSYERSFAQKFSAVAGFSMMPETKATSIFVVDKAIDKWMSEEEDLINDLSTFNIANSTLTGEVRYYAGKHPGARGFYVSLYGRYMNTSINYPLEYESSSENVYTLPFDGKIQGIGGGLMIGAQWLLYKNFTLDWYILGAHYGRTTIDLPARTDLSTMTETEKQELKQDFESLNEDFDGRASIKANVTDQGIDVKGNAPFAGVRGFGFNIGYTF
ncbi:DUF3575 domain-containing protein [uncultured Pontibacter sp.]|uniref:DUF3575 domain-containing protein n=1 Tax=uncultured Pontibacter sp. TaxID=453356 RepID=UPI002614CBCD|nr:DUF3575 domain-containing protein [uncultured Pontibacter sp.]